MTPLEQATQAAVAEQLKLMTQVKELERDVRSALDRESILKGKIDQLETELENIRLRSDHNLQWAVEVTKQLHNIGLFVSDALNLARHEVRSAQGNGRDIQSALDAVEKALGGGHVAIQHQGERQGVQDNKV
jgi:hypothetical protein